MDWTQLLSVAGPYIAKLASGAASGAAKGRQDEAVLNTSRDQQAGQQFATQQAAQMNAGSLDLQRKGFQEDVRGSRAKQAAIADMLANFKGTQINVPGIQNASVSGGLNVNSPGLQQAMAKLREQALMAQLQGDTPGGEQFQGGALLKAPGVTPIPQASGWERFMGIASQAAGWGSLIGDLTKAKKYGGGGITSDGTYVGE